MSEATVTQLPAETVKLITSTQVVTSVSTAVKELVENSIDAGAKVIQIRLENYGLDLIEVKDDGSGVSYDNVYRMFLPGYTSKISKFDDLDKLYSYGFRGEALAAMCKVAKVTITTKTSSDSLAMTYDIDSSGTPLSSKPNHLNKGTVITICDLFSNLPVRRLYLSSKKKISEELKKTEFVVQSLSLIHPRLGVSLVHNKCPIWKKNAVGGIKQSFMQVAGLKTVSKMDHINKLLDQVHVDLIIPKKNLDNPENVFTNSAQSIYVYVNKRHVICKSLSQPVLEHIFYHFSNLATSYKSAVCLVSVEVPPNQIDINLEPNKTKVLLKNQRELIKVLDEILSNYYEHQNFVCSAIREAVIEELPDNKPEEKDEEEEEIRRKKPRLETSDGDNNQKSKTLLEKNKNWELEIIDVDCVDDSNVDKKSATENGSTAPSSLCSQINSENCTLTTEKEISELNAILNETHYKLVTTTNSKNSESRLIDRNDIQSRTTEKPILQEWPCRPKVIIESQLDNTQTSSSLFGSSESQVKTVEEIAADIESEAEKWSSEMIGTMKMEKKEVESSSKLQEDCGQFDLSMQSISSQMGKKEMKAFTKFARIMRPKIVEEFPKILFTQVAGILAERWKNLTPEEVKYYENVAEVVDLNRKIHLEDKQNQVPKKVEKPPKQNSEKSDSVLAMFEKMKKKIQINRPPRKEVSFVTSLSDACKRPNLTGNFHEEEFQLIGQLQPSGNWLYKKGKEIGHVRHQGLKELITYQKMLANHCVPRKVLDKPVLINEDNLGRSLWDLLNGLDLQYDSNTSKFIITSDVITKNGFMLEIDKSGNFPVGYMKEVALSIPHYGISELKDTLSMYQKHGEVGGLACWRPTAVINYLTNEAVRLTQQETTPPNRDEIENMLETYHLCLTHLLPVCLHSKEIFVSFYNTEDKLIDGHRQQFSEINQINKLSTTNK